jgi:chaperonin GroEL (HSP60 family)
VYLFSIKEQAAKLATESASMILRIDGVIASTKPKEPATPPSGPESEEY